MCEEKHFFFFLNWSHREASQVVPPSPAIRVSLGAQGVVEPVAEVEEGLRAGDYVEGGRQGATLVKVTHPQLRPRELPLNVSVILGRA